jgi:outer membrane protein assembly factor BamB
MPESSGGIVINKKNLSIALTALLVLSCVVSVLPYLQAQTTASSGSLNQYEWAQMEGDSAMSRFSAGPAPSTSNVLWKTNITGVQPYLSAFNGKIYVCSTSTAYALDQDGNIIWQTDFPQQTTWPMAYKIDSTHMVIENYCFDPETGDLLWTSSDFNTFTGIFNTNVYSPEEQMFYTKINSTVVGWDFSNPSQPPTKEWTTYIRGGGITGIGTAYGEGKVFTGSFENLQYALDARTGEVIWATPTKGPMIFTGSYAEGMYFKGGSDDNTMYCFNASTGEVIWRYRPDTDGYFVTGSAVGYGLVYSMNKDGYLYAFNMYTGEVVWKYKGPNDSLMWPGMPSVADGKIYVTTGEAAQYNKPYGTSEFSCLDAITGDKLWSFEMEALPPRESVAIAYGTLYIIPGDVTTSVDTISGNEYATDEQVWAIKDVNLAAPDRVSTNWRQWRADSAHSSTAPVGPSNLTVAWRYQTGGSVISSPTVSDDIVYFGSTDSYIYAVDAWTGQLYWKFQTGAPVESSVAVANGWVYTGGDDGYVYCLNPCTGEMKWKTFVDGNKEFTFGNLILKSSPAVANGAVYIGSLDGYLYALDWDTGAIQWKTQAGGPIESSPAYADGAVYFTAEEPDTGMVYKVNSSTGAVQWNFSIAYRPSFTGGNQMLGSPSVADGKVFASSNWGDYYALDIQTGAELWHFYDDTATEFIVSSPIWVDGVVYLIDKFDLAAVNGTTGSAIWSKYTGDELYVSPSYADGKVYMVTSQRHIFVLDVNSGGNVIANATTLSSSWSSPTIANNRLYIGCNDWNVYCFKENITSTSNSQLDATPTPLEPFTWRDYAIIVATIAIILIVLSVILYRRLKK